MSLTAEHPDIARYKAEKRSAPPAILNADDLRRLMEEAGADDCGFVDVADPALAGQAGLIKTLLPSAKTALSFVCRMNRETVRSTVRSAVNQEFHQTYDEVNIVAHKAVRALEDKGITALNPAAAFPMEAQSFPANMQTISHKPIAEAAGLGRMGLHRNVIHPRFGNFILLGTILIDRPVSAYTAPLDYAPCLDCKLCVAACPVEAIGHDGSFNFSACYTHNYREFLGGFNDWIHEVVEAKDAEDYDRRVPPGESVSMWQSLSFKPGYKAAYCVSVCPAGSDVLGPFIEDRSAYRERILGPLLAKTETIFVLEGSDAEETVPARFKNKQLKRVDWSITADNPFSFLFGLTLTFQRRKARGLDASLHLVIEDQGPLHAGITVRNRRVEIGFAASETPDTVLTLSWQTLLDIFEGKEDLADAVKTGTARIEGDEETVFAIRACFPRYKTRGEEV
ncbi:SCP2 sterol-binding domain-containing protein [Tepidicaulis sp. LMO-SS28]|uniref:epoxyqueuosine reductase n=1 Tax=Tepidicaulis sp. LMO-SS28 TaxID=3447455 RepID=UPI003EE3743D